MTIWKRPISKKEIGRGETDIITVEDTCLTVSEEKEKVNLTKFIETHWYWFDAVFNEKITNAEVK